MNDASVRVDLNTSSRVAAEALNSLMPPFGWPKLEVPSAFRKIAEQNIARIKESNDKMQTASTEMTDILRAMYPTAAKGAADYSAKVIEMANTNTRTACNFFSDLIHTTSLQEAIKLSTEHARTSFTTVSAQNMELWQLAQKVATETAEPIRQSFTTVLREPA